MSVVNYTISELMGAVWGLTPVFSIPEAPSMHTIESWLGVNRYKVKDEKANQAEAEGYKMPEDKRSKSIDIYKESGELKASELGTEIYFPIIIGGEKLKRFDPRDGAIEMVATEEFLLPVATLADFDRSKKVVTTEMSAGYGTVKELYSFGDWNIKIKALLFDEGKSGRTAIELRRKLREFEGFADSIPVNSWLMDEMGIGRIVIEKISFKQTAKMPWVIGVDIDASSDASLELDINSGLEYKRMD